MTDDSEDDLPDLPPFAEFLQSLPPEAVERLLDGKMVIGEPDEGLKLLHLAAEGTEEHQPYIDLIMGMDSREELSQTMAHLQAVLVNLHQLIGVIMAKRIKLMLDEDDDLYNDIMGRDWGPGA